MSDHPKVRLDGLSPDWGSVVSVMPPSIDAPVGIRHRFSAARC
jgi:hypothetical protein